MVRNYNRWTRPMDETLRLRLSQRVPEASIARELNGAHGTTLTQASVMARIATLGLREVEKRGPRITPAEFFTDERRRELADMWERGLSLQRMREHFDYAVHVSAISLKAKEMKLPARYRKFVDGVRVLRVRGVDDAVAAPVKPKREPRFVNPKVTGCPFIAPVKPIARCGEPGENGSQYCRRHRPIVAGVATTSIAGLRYGPRADGVAQGRMGNRFSQGERG